MAAGGPATWLLTGGAGYIGSHISRALLAAGRSVVVLDDLSTGRAERVPKGVPLVRARCQDAQAVAQALEEHRAGGVVHLAAKKAAPESVEQPLWYYRENLDGTLGVLEAMQSAGVELLLYSSSAAAYGSADSGEPDGAETLSESSPTRPQSPYGETKLVSEWAIAATARAALLGRGVPLRWISLRYFNVAGAGEPALGDTAAFNLIPLVFRALTSGARPQVFGDDYPTRDGSCIRDYIHVVDLAEAHVAAVKRLEAGPAATVYNVGRGEGVTVKEVMAAIAEVTGRAVDYEVVSRRPGDPACVVARADRARAELGWTARYGLADMVRSAWEAWQAAP